jgi:hypothetical protein
MLDLDKLRKKLDLALSRETEESLTNWLLSVRTREAFSSNRPYQIKTFNWKGAMESYLKNAPPVNSLINPDLILGFKGITYLENGEAVLCEYYHTPPPDPIYDTNFQKNRTPNFSESFFYLNF